MTDASAIPATGAEHVPPPADLAGRARRLLSALVVPFLAILTAMIAGGLVIVFTNPDTLEAWGNFFSEPGTALKESWQLVYDSYFALFDTSLGSMQAFGRTLNETTPLLFAGLGVALAFRAGLFNIGAAGQILMGSALAGYIGFTWDLPAPIHLPAAIIAGFVGGMVWGGIAGFLKARTGAHEVISTIMLNFIALRLLDYMLSTDPFQRVGRNDPISKPVRESAQLPTISESMDVHLGIVLALAAAYGVWWLLERSSIGFRLRAVGANPNAARYAGMSVGATYMLAMGLAGGLAGLAGTANLLGVESYSLTPAFYNYIGFDAIALALLGKANPAGVVASAFLFGVMRAGATGMQAQTSTPVDIILVIQALIIVFVAAPQLVRAIYRIKAAPMHEGPVLTTTWGS